MKVFIYISVCVFRCRHNYIQIEQNLFFSLYKFRVSSGLFTQFRQAPWHRHSDSLDFDKASASASETCFCWHLGRLASFTARAMAFQSICGLAATTSFPVPVPVPNPDFPSYSLLRLVLNVYPVDTLCVSLCGHVTVYGFALPLLAPYWGASEEALGVFPSALSSGLHLGGCLVWMA